MNMAQQCAVVTDTALARGALSLKHAALFYDRIILLRTEEAKFDVNRNARSIEQLLGRDHDFLIEHGVVSVVDDNANQNLVDNDATYAAHRREVQTGICNALLLDSAQAEPYARLAASGSARSFAFAHEIRNQEPCTPIVFGANLQLDSSVQSLLPRPEADDQLTSAFALTLQALPTPSSLTSWQQILEFRSDQASREAHLDLRSWLSDAVRKKLDPIEFQLHLESQLSRYERALRLHRIKCSLRRLQAVVTAPLSFAEKIVKLQWSDAAKSLFDVASQEVDFMKEEAQLASRELRYFVLARDALEVEE
jgi:hypothetical protein